MGEVAGRVAEFPDPGLPCFRCGTAIVPMAWGSLAGAMAFTSRGSYGSRVFDPATRERIFLRVNVCDACVTAGAADGSLVLGENPYQPSPPPAFTPFVPGEY